MIVFGPAGPHCTHPVFVCLQVWVDSLNPEFLEPAMAEVIHEIMPALWALLKPSPYPIKAPANTAMTLLGKLGE